MDSDLQGLARRDWALVYQLGHVLTALSRQAFQQLGYGRWNAYLEEVLDLSFSTARRFIELVAGLDAHPALRASFAAGRLCPAKVELLLPCLRRASPAEASARIAQAERLGVRGLRRSLEVELESEPDLVYCSFELTGSEVLAWREVREAARAHLEARISRAEVLEYAVAEFLSGEERVGYEEVLLPPRPALSAGEGCAFPVDLVAPILPKDPVELQALALALLEERKGVALRQGDLLVELVCQGCRRSAVGRIAREELGISRSTAYKRMALARGCARYPALGRLSPERALLVLPLLDAGVSNTWTEFASSVSLPELQRWVRHVRWQSTFRFEEFSCWMWRAPNPGERPPDVGTAGLLPTLVQRPLDGSLVLAVRALAAGSSGIEYRLGPVQVSEEIRTRVGWMVPRDFVPLLYEGIDLAGDSLFAAPGTSLKRMFELFTRQYGSFRGGGRKGRVRRRDGHCCQAPGCTGRGKLHVHHLVFRSHGGSDESWNLVLVCSACHRLIHLGLLRVSGRAPYDLVWTRACERWEKGRRVKPGSATGQAGSQGDASWGTWRSSQAGSEVDRFPSVSGTSGTASWRSPGEAKQEIKLEVVTPITSSFCSSRVISTFESPTVGREARLEHPITGMNPKRINFDS